jgi:hypothetical protein
LQPAAQPDRLAAPVPTAVIASVNAAQSLSAAASWPIQLGQTSCWAAVGGAGPAEHRLHPQTHCLPAPPLVLPVLLPLLLQTALPALPHHQTCQGPSHAQVLQGPGQSGGCAAAQLLVLLLRSCLSAPAMLLLSLLLLRRPRLAP